MRILQAGYYRSGNYWLWTILDAAREIAGLPRTSFIERQPIHRLAKGWPLSFQEQARVDFLQIAPGGVFWGIWPRYSEKIQDLTDYLTHARHVWTHCACPGDVADLLSRFDKLVYVVRDPRNVLLSILSYERSPFRIREYTVDPKPGDQAMRFGKGTELRDWQLHVARWLSVHEELRVHVVFYERLLHAFESEVASLLNHLELDLPPDAIEEIGRRTSFSTKRDQSPSHVREGVARRWASTLDDASQSRALGQCGTLLDMLGYPRARKNALEFEPSSSLPKFSRTPEQRVILNRLASDEPLGALNREKGSIARTDRYRLLAERVSYRLGTRSTDSTACVYLYASDLEFVLPAAAFQFAIELARHDQFSSEEAVGWLGNSFVWSDVQEILSFLLSGGLLGLD